MSQTSSIPLVLVHSLVLSCSHMLRTPWLTDQWCLQVLVDELGRGTSPEDGLAIAMAFAEFMVERGTKTLLTTHLHELALSLRQTRAEQIRFLCTRLDVRTVKGLVDSYNEFGTVTDASRGHKRDRTEPSTPLTGLKRASTRILRV